MSMSIFVFDVFSGASEGLVRLCCGAGGCAVLDCCVGVLMVGCCIVGRLLRMFLMVVLIEGSS